MDYDRASSPMSATSAIRGPLFEVLNKAIGKIEDARSPSIRAAKATP